MMILLQDRKETRPRVWSRYGQRRCSVGLGAVAAQRAALFFGALLLITVFYPLLLLGETLCVQYAFPPSVSLLLGNIALLAISLGMTGKLLLR